MKKFVLSFFVLAIAVVAVGALFKEQLWEVAKQAITADMYVAADTDSFDPGISVGSSFPAIKALHDGREVYGAGEFVRDKGMVFIANRSADW